jgi:hypothetical protein
VVLTHAAKELVWLRKLFSDLCNSPDEATVLFCDNQGAIALSKDPTFHARTKHIDVRFHFIRQIVDSGNALLNYCSTNDMVADIFTKSLACQKLEKFQHALGLRYPPAA